MLFRPFVASITSVNDDEAAAVALLIVLQGGSDLFLFLIISDSERLTQKKLGFSLYITTWTRSLTDQKLSIDLY